jgi:hypothetical protein
MMALSIDGGVLYAGGGDVLRVLDIADPRHPRLLGKVSGLGAVRQVAVQNSIAYVSAREHGLWIVDCADPRAPRLRSRFDCCELATGVDVAGDVCFLGQRQNGVEFIDVSDPEEPRHIAMRSTDESQSVKYRDGFLYSGEWGSGMVTVFDAHDMSDIRKVASLELHGYGDGVWMQGNFLFCATGHHSRHRKVDGGVVTDELRRFGGPSAGAGMGHGLDIFDISDPRSPRHVSRVDYPPFFARGLDMWTPRTSGNLLFASQTHNGLFAVDIEDKSHPVVLDRWTLPSPGKPEWPSMCIGSVAVGNGVVYAAVRGSGLYVIPAAGARVETSSRGVLPKNASYRETYETDGDEFWVWKPEREGQARGAAVSGDVLYAAFGDAGLHVLKIRPEGGFEKIGELAGHKKVFDVSVFGKTLCTAEGPDGFAFYEMDAPARFREIGRIPRLKGKPGWAFWSTFVDERYVALSVREGGYWLYDVSDMAAPRALVSVGGCPGWDRYLADAPVGRRLAFNAANNHLDWIDIDANPLPTVSMTKTNRTDLYSGICRFSEDVALMTRGCDYMFLRPGEGDRADGSKWKTLPFPGPKTRGIPRSDGRFVAKTCRIEREVTLYDFADPVNPKFLKRWKVSGNPEAAVFHRGRVIVPCGHQGVIMQRRSADAPAAVYPYVVSKDVRLPPPDSSRIAEIAGFVDEEPSVCSPEGCSKLDFGTDEECIARAEKSVGTVPEAFPVDLYREYYKSGERQAFQNWRRRFVETFEFLCEAERRERRGRFIPDIAARMEAFAQWPSWGMPKFDMALAKPGSKTIAIDLLSSALACRLAERLLELGASLPATTVEKVRREMRRRVFDPYLAVAADTEHGNDWKRGNWWFDTYNNWNAVCHSCCVRAALAGLRDRRERAMFVEAAERALDAYFSGFAPDGYCSEGVGYWNYGYGHFLSMGLAVRKATRGRVDFLAHPKAKAIMRYPFAYRMEKDKSPRFADGEGRPAEYVLEMAYTAWPEMRAEAERTLPIRDVFPYGQVWIFRMPGETSPSFSFAMKGGSNGELHNHNDVGSWNLMLDGVAMAGDPEKEVYSRRTFSKDRYKSDVLNSYGHPVPRVGGRLQCTGGEFRGRVVGCDFTDDRDVVTLDLSEAYDLPSLEHLTRTVVFDRRFCSVTITDRVGFAKPEAFDDPIITYCDVQTVAPGSIVLVDPKGDGRIECAAKATGGEWSMKTDIISNPGKSSPRRVAVEMSAPVMEAEVVWRFAPMKGEMK